MMVREPSGLTLRRSLTQLQGVIISSAVLPATLTLMWNKQNLAAAALSPVLGLACSLIAWLVTAKKEYGNLSVASTGSKYVFCSPLLHLKLLHD